jgi:hypothetical protein
MLCVNLRLSAHSFLPLRDLSDKNGRLFVPIYVIRGFFFYVYGELIRYIGSMRRMEFRKREVVGIFESDLPPEAAQSRVQVMQ